MKWYQLCIVTINCSPHKIPDEQANSLLGMFFSTDQSKNKNLTKDITALVNVAVQHYQFVTFWVKTGCFMKFRNVLMHNY